MEDPMDYKDRNPVLSQTKKFQMIVPGTCPFDQLTMYVLEYHAPDESTRFLGLFGRSGTSEDIATQYLIEAPLDCKNRQAFEIGDMTWSDYWRHKSWMICIRSYIYDSNIFTAEYITPYQMDKHPVSLIRKFNKIAPMDEKLRALSNIVVRFKDSSEFLYDYHKIYRDFIPVYQRRMGKRAA
jgi:hypothetical protein